MAHGGYGKRRVKPAARRSKSLGVEKKAKPKPKAKPVTLKNQIRSIERMLRKVLFVFFCFVMASEFVYELNFLFVIRFRVLCAYVCFSKVKSLFGCWEKQKSERLENGRRVLRIEYWHFYRMWPKQLGCLGQITTWVVCGARIIVCFWFL